MANKNSENPEIEETPGNNVDAGITSGSNGSNIRKTDVEPYEHNYKYLIPALIVSVMLGVFLLINWMFIQCPDNLCDKVDGKLFDVNDKDLIGNTAEIKKKIDALPRAKSSPTASAKAEETETKKKPETTANTATPDTNTAINTNAAVNSNTATNVNTATNANAATANVTTNANTNTNTKTNSNKAGDKPSTVDKFRQSLSTRYENRIKWIFQTTIFFLLMIGIVWFAGYVVIQAFKKETNDEERNSLKKATFVVRQPLFIAPYVIISLLLIVAFIFSIDIKFYSPVTYPMFEETIYKFEGIRSFWFGFTNALVFIAIGGLVTASCAIFYKIRILNHKHNGKSKEIKKLNIRLAEFRAKASELAKVNQQLSSSQIEERDAADRDLEELENEMTDDYKDWKVYTKGLLYIGGAVLTFGLLRVNTLSEWHLAFVESDYQKFLKDFFSDSLLNLAFFYTILLMAIYLPISYSLPETSDDPTVENSLSRKGFFATITKFAPPLIALLSPLLTESIESLSDIITGIFQ